MGSVSETLDALVNRARLQKLLTFPLSDAGNAEVFAEEHGTRFRYDHTRQKWRVWNGRYWAADETGERSCRARNCACKADGSHAYSRFRSAKRPRGLGLAHRIYLQSPCDAHKRAEH